MAIAFGTVTRGTSTGTSSLSFSHTVASGTTLLLVLINHSRGAESISGVTWNGTSMTRAVASTTNVGAYIYYLQSPTATTANVVVSVSAGTDRAIVASAQNVSGTLTSGVIGATNTANGTSTTPSVSVTTTASNSVVVDAMTQVFNTNTITVGADQTQITNQNQSGTSQGETACASYEAKATAGSVTMSWSSNNSNQWDSCVVEVKAVQDAPKLLALLGVG